MNRDEMHGGVEPKPPTTGVQGNPLARLVVLVLRGYKTFVSPLFPPSCRFTPTCSQYAIEAVQRRGVVRGLCLSVWRLLRCHPFARGGYDPVK
jgi:putative membrane protein insertion efficiency factor